MNKLFEYKHQQRWLDREHETSARAKAIKEGTYCTVKTDPLCNPSNWYVMDTLMVYLKDDAEILGRFSQGFADWKGVSVESSKDPLRNAIDDAIRQLK